MTPPASIVGGLRFQRSEKFFAINHIHDFIIDNCCTIWKVFLSIRSRFMQVFRSNIKELFRFTEYN